MIRRSAILLLVASSGQAVAQAPEAPAPSAAAPRAGIETPAARLLPPVRPRAQNVDPAIVAAARPTDPTDEFVSLLRHSSGDPVPVPLNARSVPGIAWPTPFAEQGEPVADGEPLPLIEQIDPQTPRTAVPRAPLRATTVIQPAAAPEPPVPTRAASTRPRPKPSQSAEPTPPAVETAAAPPAADTPRAPQPQPAALPPTPVVSARVSPSPLVPRRHPRRAPPPPTSAVATGPADTPIITASYSPPTDIALTATDTLLPPADFAGLAGRPLNADEEALLLDTVAAAPKSSDASEEDVALEDEVPPPPYDYAGPSPAQLVRTLVRLQDDIARGAVSALQAQRLVLRRIAVDFPAYPGEVWADPRQARALLTYALSGADPRVVRPAFDLGTIPRRYEPLVRGALAYLEGRERDALRVLEPIDINTVDRSVRGALSLAMAALVVDEDPAAADAFLARSRYAAPGSLVEEAALRRAALIAAERNDVEQLKRLVNRYLRKFRRSIYAGNFRRRLSAALTRMEFISSPEAFASLEETLAPMTDAGRRELYLLVARAAVEFGREDAARLASEAALALSEAGTMDEKRAQLYLAAANVVHPDHVLEAEGMLDALREEGGLDPSDQQLLDAAAQLSLNVSRLPEPAAGDDAADASETVPREVDDMDDSLTDPFTIDPAVEARVDQAIAAVDALLRTSP